jgi:uncharacterized phage protein (TIGR02218 family)
MSFELFDISEFDSAPLELFEITAGPQVWRHASGNSDITFLDNVFTKLAIERDGEEIKSDAADQRMTVSLPETHPVGHLFMIGDPEVVVGVRVWRAQRDSLTDFEVVGTWQIRSVMYDGAAKVYKLACDVFAGRLRQRCCSQVHGSRCQAALYTFPCPVLLVDYTHTGTLTAVVGNQITSPDWEGFDAAYFPAGFVAIGGAHRTIKAYDPVTGKLTLRAPILGLSVGQSVDAHPGCDGSPESCRGKFGSSTDDGAAFVGFPHVPREDIYAGRAKVV